LVQKIPASGEKANWQLATGNWQLATGNWQLATGNWQLATGNWQLATGNWQLYLDPGDESKPIRSRNGPFRSGREPCASRRKIMPFLSISLFALNFSWQRSYWLLQAGSLAKTSRNPTRATERRDAAREQHERNETEGRRE
jgi:hypothetical protein